MAQRYTLLKNLISPAKATDKGINDLLKALWDHLSPKPSVIAERFRFHKRDQRPGESVLSYIAELRNLATHCQFDASLNDTLRDRLVECLCNDTKQTHNTQNQHTSQTYMQQEVDCETQEYSDECTTTYLLPV